MSKPMPWQDHAVTIRKSGEFLGLTSAAQRALYAYACHMNARGTARLSQKGAATIAGMSTVTLSNALKELTYKDWVLDSGYRRVELNLEKVRPARNRPPSAEPEEPDDRQLPLWKH